MSLGVLGVVKSGGKCRNSGVGAEAINGYGNDNEGRIGCIFWYELSLGI